MLPLQSSPLPSSSPSAIMYMLCLLCVWFRTLSPPSNFVQDVTCEASDGAAQDSNDENSVLQCSSSSSVYMLGCTAHTTDQYFDGVYPGTQHPNTITATGSDEPYSMTSYCNGVNGDHDDTRSNINCCTASVGLECNVYYADPGTDNELSCPSDQTLMACMGTEYNRATKLRES